jgi:outer membrane protein OmpA-like peptidoglycan-associated protein
MTRLALFSTAISCTFLCTLNILAQTCPPPEDISPKTSKLFEKATESKKNRTSEERIEMLLEVVDEQDDFGSAYSALAKLLFKKAKGDLEVRSECQAAISKWCELCKSDNDFAEANYMLGALAYIAGDADVALSEFELFISKTDEGSKKEVLKSSLEQKRLEVLKLISEVRFEVQYFINQGSYLPQPLPLISLPEDEYLPALSPDGSSLFFTRARIVKPRGDVVTKRVEEFIQARRSTAEEGFDKGELLDYPFNDGENYGGVSLSIDNRLLIVAASNPSSENPENIDLFKTTYNIDGKDDKGKFFYYWGDLELLGPQINTPQGWESQPTLSADGKELFFASARENSTLDPDGNPTMDLYASVKTENGDWSQAEKLPPPISTGAQEKAPFLHSDGNTLYFSSNRIPSGGGYDLWVTRRDTSGIWSDPVNLGAPVNTNGDEHGLVVCSNGTEAFFSSRRKGTQGLDILSFPIPEELRPEAVKVIHGVVHPTPPSEDVRVSIEYVQSREVQEIKLNYDDGSFATVINLNRGEDVVIHVEGDDLEFEAEIVHLAKRDGAIPSNIEDTSPVIKLRAQKTFEEDAFELKDVQFETNKSEITYTTRLILKAFTEYLLTHEKYSISIIGHADNIGSAQSNLQLSSDRAEAVLQFFVDLGVDESRLDANGSGETNPKASNNNETGRAVNRRTEFRITN